MTKATILTKPTTPTTPKKPHFSWADDGDETPDAVSALNRAANLTVANGGVVKTKMKEMKEKNLVDEQIQFFLGSFVSPDTKLTIWEFMKEFGFKVDFRPLYEISVNDAVFTLCDTAHLMEKLYFIHQILDLVGVKLSDQNMLRRDIVSFLEINHPNWVYSDDIWGTVVHLVKVYTEGLLEAKPDGSLPPFVEKALLQMALAREPVMCKIDKYQPCGRQFAGRDNSGKTKFFNRGVKDPLCIQIAKMAKPVSELLTNAEEVPGLVSWFFGFYIQGKTMIFDSRLFAGLKKPCRWGSECRNQNKKGKKRCPFDHSEERSTSSGKSSIPITHKKKSQRKKKKKSKGRNSKN